MSGSALRGRPVKEEFVLELLHRDHTTRAKGRSLLRLLQSRPVRGAPLLDMAASSCASAWLCLGTHRLTGSLGSATAKDPDLASTAKQLAGVAADHQTEAVTRFHTTMHCDWGSVLTPTCSVRVGQAST